MTVLVDDLDHARKIVDLATGDVEAGTIPASGGGASAPADQDGSGGRGRQDDCAVW